MADAPSPLPEDATELLELRSRIEQLTLELEEARLHAARLEAIAHEDALTGVLNRRGFMRDLTRALAYGSRYNARAALILLDLDAFKPVNDRHGHAVGDRALKHVADILRAHIRASDSLGRLGGDEFALIIWQVDAPAAEQKARFVEDLIAGAPLTLGASTLRLAVSAGSTPLRADEAPEDALARADRAMYARKEERGLRR
jgi:diguanylate cyclase (GGDEF)-like protein